MVKGICREGIKDKAGFFHFLAIEDKFKDGRIKLLQKLAILQQFESSLNYEI